MPIYKNPFEKGVLYIKFDVKFPENNELSEEAIKKLETILPAKPKVEIPTGDHVDEVSMMEYTATKGSSSGGFRGESSAGAGFFRGGDDDDEDDEGGAGGQKVECNTH